MAGQLSVTVLTGSPGNDGTRVFEQIIQQSSDLRLTAIVPKRSKRKNRSRGPVPMIPTTEHLVRLGEGCACCTVRGDLMAKVQRIADEKSAEHILIHTSPHADLQTLAKTFTVADQSGSVLSDVAQIGSLVAVVDAGSFLDTLQGANARKLFERLELANVVLVEGGASVSATLVEQVLGTIKAINASARVVHAQEGGLSLSSLHADQPFDLDLAEERASGGGGLAAQVAVHASTIKFSFQARRPFHPSRLHAFLGEPSSGVLRVKGTFWVASRPDFACNLDVAGGSRSMAPEGMWWATVSEQERPKSPDFQRYLESMWHPEFGDRHQNLSVIGTGVTEGDLRDRLEACLLTDEEVKAPEQWATLADPFPWPSASA